MNNTPYNTGFASGGVKCKLGALCSETRPNAKPETVMGKFMRRQTKGQQQTREPAKALGICLQTFCIIE